MQENFVSLGGYRYLRWALWLSGASVIAYWWHSPQTVPNGGTWLGYALGTIGALIIIWLFSFGWRKRSYRANLGDVRHWLSAHVWLGLALLLVVTLHTGFQFGWNVHTLAYGLMVAVIASGIWGVVMYLRHPALMSGLLDGKTLVQHGDLIREMDAQAQQMLNSATTTDREILAKSLQAASDEPLIPSLRERLFGPSRDSATARAIDTLEQQSLSGNPISRQLTLLMVKRDHQVKRVRQFLRLKTLTDFWLLLHVPISSALLATLIAHIVSVFFYW